MADASVASFLAGLREYDLLTPAQWQQLGDVPEDFQTLARALTCRQWLTEYQVNEIKGGRAAELTWGPYVVLDRLGDGGTGRLFKARHRFRERLAAVKVLREDLFSPSDQAGPLLDRFRREPRALAALLAHPHVVDVFDAGQQRGRWFLAMAYLEGTDLQTLVQAQGPLPIGRACSYTWQAALGLQHLHEHHMVHRDIKPGNLLVNAADGQVKILDLGLVRVLQGGRAHETTWELPCAGVQMGTPAYMAPEQAADPHQVDIRADVYSLGRTLCFLLRGQVPDPSEGAEVVAQLRPEVPAALRGVLRRMTAARPQDRYAAPAQVAAALARFCDLPPGPGHRVAATASGQPARASGPQTASVIGASRSGRPIWRSPWMTLVLLACLLLLGLELLAALAWLLG